MHSLYRQLILLLAIANTLLMYSCKSKPDQSTPVIQKEKMDVKNEIKTKSNKSSILFYGNSLTAGYGLEEANSFPSLIRNLVDSLGLQYDVINAGLSGETTSGGLNRIDWVLNQKVDIFVLELGANDMLRGLPLDETYKNLNAILTKVKTKYPNVRLYLCEMMAAPNMGLDYTTKFKAIYSRLAIEQNATLIPFFLEGVAGHPELLLPDGKHPNAEGQKIVAKNIWKGLKLG